MNRKAVLLPIVALLAMAGGGYAVGQVVSPLTQPASSSDVATLQAAIPKPATAAPMVDTMGGAVGSETTLFALANHQHPRRADSQIVTTTAGGVFSGTYPAGFFPTAPTVDISWVNKGALSMTCELTNDPTTSGFTGRCTTISLAALLAAGAGVKVHVVSFPVSTS